MDTWKASGRVAAACALVVGFSIAATAGAAGAPLAPGAPGAKATWTPADKHGFGTARGRASDVWFTLREGELSELFYPDLSTPAVRDVEFLVTDGHGLVEATTAARTTTAMPDPRVPAFTQVDTSPTGRWRMVRRVITDPVRDAVDVSVQLTALDGRSYQVWVVVDPSLSNGGMDDRASLGTTGVVAWDQHAALVVRASKGLADRSVGFLGRSDLRTDLLRDGRLDSAYARTRRGNVVLGGRLVGVTGRPGARRSTVVLGFGGGRARVAHAALAARTSLTSGFVAKARSYAAGWHSYFAGLHPVPASAAPVAREYLASLTVIAASEDKRNPGAYIASPTTPWVWGQDVPGLSTPSGPYHLVWSRDLYQHATALSAAGDTPGANRALDFLLFRQQKKDGSFPQNSEVTGKPHWTSLQMDEVALPLVLAYELGRTDDRTYPHLKRAADFLVSYRGKHSAPWTEQERWENQDGYSPGTIADEIAGLLCAADIAGRRGDTASASLWTATARDWAARVDGWTATSTGPLSNLPYYLRLTKDGDPNSSLAYNGGDGGSTHDQRAVVDPSFLELVRLGIKDPHDPVVVNSLAVVDADLAVETASGTFWHRFTDDGYGETGAGAPWHLGTPDQQSTRGRAWPIFAGERGEYEVAAGVGDPAARLLAMARTANDGMMIGEQVWDGNAPTGRAGYPSGKGTFSATPLTWSHAELVRLAWTIQDGAVYGQPAVVGCVLRAVGCAP
jgi:glucoamylase